MIFTAPTSKMFCQICTVLTGLLLASNVIGQTFNVDTDQDTNDVLLNDGICADENELCSLRAAIQEANALIGPDEIIVGPGTFKLSIADVDPVIGENAAVTGDLDITGVLKLSGAGREETTIDANNIDRVFHIMENSDVTISGVAASNGAGGQGGGVLVSASAVLTITDCIISGSKNDAMNGKGAGIYNAGSLSVDNCIIKDNVSNYMGGGLINYSGATATIKNTHMHDNSATYGGGIFVWQYSTTTLEGVTLSNNHATTMGGAIGGWSGGAEVNLINSTISGNRSDGNGGGIFIESVVINMFNTTISNNIAVDEAGLLNGGTVNMANSIIASNIATGGSRPDCSSYRTINSQGYNLIGNAGSDCFFNISVGDQIGNEINPVQALLWPLADNGGPTPTHSLQKNSPASNAGSPATPGSSSSACEAIDQRGITRINGSVCDIGAYEQTTIADLWVSMINSADVVDDSGIMKQVVKVGNKGPNQAVDISLVVKFPEGSVNHRAAGGAWQCHFGSEQIDCHLAFLDFNRVSEVELLFWPPTDFTALTTKASVKNSTFDWQLKNNEFELQVVGEAGDNDESASEEGGSSDFTSTTATASEHSESVNSNQQLSRSEDQLLQEDSNQAMPASTPAEGDWVVMLQLIKHAGNESGDEAGLLLSDVRQQLLSDYNSEDESRIKKNAGIVGLGAVFLAGIVNIYTPSASIFGFLFSFPLWAHLDPVNLIVLSDKDRRRRKRERKDSQKEEGRSSAYKKILDDVSEKH